MGKPRSFGLSCRQLAFQEVSKLQRGGLALLGAEECLSEKLLTAALCSGDSRARNRLSRIHFQTETMALFTALKAVFRQ